ncbi:hypothetical protein [Deinococcus altitudinis]|uniref:hypothetical protein n=1 Tax=Deinococcus altitudinis TaxID=468914 RepID=UPI0038918E0E
MTERAPIDRAEARAKLKSSVDTLVEQANLQVKMQKEPLKMLGGATGVGVALGVLVGRSLRRSKRIYVDAASSKKEQKSLSKAQSKKGGGGIGNAVLATVATLGFKMLQEKVIAPRLGEIADRLLEKGGSAGGSKAGAHGTGTGSEKAVDLSKH